jgi:RimJ/RimL family protein N-acetyltransferase
MTSYSLREATKADSSTLLRWRNDPVTRQWARSSDPIAVADHERWLDAVLVDSARLLYVLDRDGQPVASVRFDQSRDSDAEAEVSIAVAPEARGQGVGTAALEVGADQVAATLPSVTQVLAVVHRDNEPSLRMFSKAGYRPRTPADPTWLELVLTLPR